MLEAEHLFSGFAGPQIKRNFTPDGITFIPHAHDLNAEIGWFELMMFRRDLRLKNSCCNGLRL